MEVASIKVPDLKNIIFFNRLKKRSYKLKTGKLYLFYSEKKLYDSVRSTL